MAKKLFFLFSLFIYVYSHNTYSQTTEIDLDTTKDVTKCSIKLKDLVKKVQITSNYNTRQILYRDIMNSLSFSDQIKFKKKVLKGKEESKQLNEKSGQDFLTFLNEKYLKSYNESAKDFVLESLERVFIYLNKYLKIFYSDFEASSNKTLLKEGVSFYLYNYEILDLQKENNKSEEDLFLNLPLQELRAEIRRLHFTLDFFSYALSLDDGENFFKDFITSVKMIDKSVGEFKDFILIQNSKLKKHLSIEQFLEQVKIHLKSLALFQKIILQGLDALESTSLNHNGGHSGQKLSVWNSEIGEIPQGELSLYENIILAQKSIINQVVDDFEEFEIQSKISRLHKIRRRIRQINLMSLGIFPELKIPEKSILKLFFEVGKEMEEVILKEATYEHVREYALSDKKVKKEKKKMKKKFLEVQESVEFEKLKLTIFELAEKNKRKEDEKAGILGWLDNIKDSIFAFFRRVI